MNSKYHEKNTKVAQFLHDEEGRGTREFFQPDLFAEIEYKEYDYLVLNENSFGDSLDFRFGTEKVKEAKNPFIKDRYCVEHEEAFVLKLELLEELGLTKEDVLKEMILLKQQEISFKNSSFYMYYIKDMEDKVVKGEETQDLSGLKRQLQEHTTYKI